MKIRVLVYTTLNNLRHYSTTTFIRVSIRTFIQHYIISHTLKVKKKSPERDLYMPLKTVKKNEEKNLKCELLISKLRTYFSYAMRDAKEYSAWVFVMETLFQYLQIKKVSIIMET